MDNEYGVIQGGRGGSGLGLTNQPHLARKILEKVRDIPLLNLRTFVAFEMGGKPTHCAMGWNVIYIFQDWTGDFSSLNLLVRYDNHVTILQSGVTAN